MWEQRRKKESKTKLGERETETEEGREKTRERHGCQRERESGGMRQKERTISCKSFFFLTVSQPH